MIGDWKVLKLPRCTHHVFLSHCAEDREKLVLPVFKTLEDNKKSPWLDRHDFPIGQAPHESLREGIVRCRHVVYFVTTKFLAQGRGWPSVENAYSCLLQENLHFASHELCHIHLPLFFVPKANPILARSAWSPLMQRGSYYASGRLNRGAVKWAAEEILSFIGQEEKRGVSLGAQVKNDPLFEPWLKNEPNLLRRVMCADPPSVELAN